MKAALDFAPDGPNPKPEDRCDVLDFSVNSDGFRSRLEGWHPSGRPWTHHQVHLWTGGDMLPLSSPNDPVFFLHHFAGSSTEGAARRVSFHRRCPVPHAAPARASDEARGDVLVRGGPGVGAAVLDDGPVLGFPPS